MYLKDMKKIAIGLLVTFLATGIAFAQLDRSKLPASGPAPEIKIGEAETFTLANGLKVFVVKNTKLPRFSFTLLLYNVPPLEGDKAGLSTFIGDMMMGGTIYRTKDVLDLQINLIGARLFASSGYVYASSLKKHQVELLEMMTDVLFNPVFPQPELDKLKKQSLTTLATTKDDPQSISSRLSRAVLYGKNHPYGESQTEQTTKNITLEDVKAYYQTYFKPNIAYLVIEGDMDKAEAERVVTQYFGAWEKGVVPTFSYPEPVRAAKQAVALVDRSSSVQSIIEVSQPVAMKTGDADDISSELLNQILGGGFGSRLNMNLREDKGYTTGAFSSIDQYDLGGSISATALVRSEVTDSAVYEIVYEINNLVKNGVTQVELDKAKAEIAGNFVRSLQNLETIADFALNSARYNLPKDYYATYLKKLNAYTVADINAAAKRLIEPDKFTITIVGNGAEIRGKLAQFGEVIEYDNMGEQLVADADMTPEKVLEKYLAAVGGADKVAAVKTAKISMDANYEGTPRTIAFVYDSQNGRYVQKVSSSGDVIQKTSLANGKGSISEQGKTIEMDPAQLAEAQLNSYLFPEAVYKANGYTVTLDGFKNVEGKAAYKVIITAASGAKLINYYAQDSGLKVKYENPASGDTYFGDYQATNGVLFPMSWAFKSPQDPEPLEAKVTSLELNVPITKADIN
jgi:zinc protease